MSLHDDRRLFLKSTGAAIAGYGLTKTARADENAPASPNERVVLGIMGVNGRGKAIARGMLASGQVEIAYICDVDQRAADDVRQLVADGQTQAPKAVGDFRRILDDKRVDALVCAAPNHWHAPATIMACGAGKHVYVEKPCSYTPAEGEMAIQAARKNNRVVQMGTQRRSWPGVMEGVQKVLSGEIGNVLYARTWYNNRRGSIGHGKTAPVPQWLDWELWQGPAPRRPFKDNVVHYNWHWHWHWGNGELGNNGVHALDVARWGLDVTYPNRVTAGGGKYRHDDDQETPDTMMVTYDFPEQKTITWEGLSWSPLGPHDSGFGISFHGTDGSLIILGSGYTQYDLKGNEVASGDGAGGDKDHFADFLGAVRDGSRPNADIEKAHQSTLLCHLGNIAYRTSSTLHTDPANGHIQDHPEAQKLWSRSYAKGWEPVV
ncbi:Gfo/Idh/MocA family oxidoreductase [Roseiconus nitratireducens]|uniref:Gfo/Idh/MocA family oxidoreductase n=1 Tax=Roseiconus nitratireducens TaxID=2605748 RepID=A0A5M6D437_9BACT|nr:Gfo/Idh/MocA family oxidoreductase [Roseiconus nitratireducens]KAA5542277.1 Gfo/Idh/MocA family oxidoreductase [Roseiconus nitratireducens]